MILAAFAVLAIAALGCVLGSYWIVVGASHDVIRRRIEIHDSGRFLSGRAAVTRGALDVAIGLAFSFGCAGVPTLRARS
jgi:uncharacterized membrane protein YedE/YeeE